MFDRVVNRGAFWSLLATRVVYALNWYNIASIFSLMAVEFGQGVSGLGALTSSFYLGVGLFQIPGGVVAARFGPRLTATFGTLVMSVAVLVSGAAATFDIIVLARFFVGVGMAFVFAPGVVLITQVLRDEELRDSELGSIIPPSRWGVWWGSSAGLSSRPLSGGG